MTRTRLLLDILRAELHWFVPWLAGWLLLGVSIMLLVPGLR